MKNVMIERLWRSLKYECVYLLKLSTERELRQALAWWFDFYNNHRPRFTFDEMKPMDICQNSKPEGIPPSGLEPKGGVTRKTVHFKFVA